MRKSLVFLMLLSGLSVSAQNEDNNPPINANDNPQVALNNDPGPMNNVNVFNNIQRNQSHQQVQQQAVVQQTTNPPNRGNFINTGTELQAPPVRQQKYGQSIQISSGASGYSGSSGKAAVKSHTHKSLEFVMKKTFKPKYKHAKHYSHKKRVKKCQSF